MSILITRLGKKAHTLKFHSLHRHCLLVKDETWVRVLSRARRVIALELLLPGVSTNCCILSVRRLGASRYIVLFVLLLLRYK